MNKQLWLIPAVASVLFLAFTVWVMVTDGPLGFLSEQFRHGWGAQIGLDLVNSVIVALFFAAPAARRYGVRPWPWLLLTIATGSIGLLALAARVLYARSASRSERVPGRTAAAPA